MNENQSEAVASNAELCTCGAVEKTKCPGEWDLGCSLGGDAAHVKVASESPGIDSALGLVLLPPIRVSERAYAVMKRIAEVRGIALQAVVREALEPSEVSGA